MKILSVQISTNDEVWSTKGLRCARFWGVMVSGASLGIGVFQWLCWGLIDGFKLFISLIGVLNKQMMQEMILCMLSDPIVII